MKFVLSFFYYLPKLFGKPIKNQSRRSGPEEKKGHEYLLYIAIFALLV